MAFAFDNTYARLPSSFFSPATPTQVRAPRVVKLNRPLAELLGFDAELLASAAGAQILSGNVVPPEACPIALAYAGHQFGSFSGQLGDGRAILLGEVVATDGRRRDVQLKGAGRTPYSRGGDGRAALGPVLREYLVSEAMAALGIPTTRALAALTTGEVVIRDEPLPGAIVVRVAASHMRVGTFELLSARRDDAGLRALTAYALARHYPERSAEENPALALLESVIAAQASLVARWLGVGFIHGVMNTDNTSISGETIDYGPCAFLDVYDPQKRFSSIDRGGRYAFANQPRIAQWNCTRLAETLLGELAPDENDAVKLATERLEQFPSLFADAHTSVLRAKLGLHRAEPGDLALAQDLLERLAANEVDYTRFFRALCGAAASTDGDNALANSFANPGAFHDWAERWRARLAREDSTGADRERAMKLVNPAYIPRNHRIEELITAAVHRANFAPFETFLDVLSSPFDDQPEHAAWAEPPRPEQRVRATYCGTLGPLACRSAAAGRARAHAAGAARSTRAAATRGRASTG